MNIKNNYKIKLITDFGTSSSIEDHKKNESTGLDDSSSFAPVYKIYRNNIKDNTSLASRIIDNPDNKVEPGCKLKNMNAQQDYVPLVKRQQRIDESIFATITGRMHPIMFGLSFCEKSEFVWDPKTLNEVILDKELIPIIQAMKNLLEKYHVWASNKLRNSSDVKLSKYCKDEYDSILKQIKFIESNKLDDFNTKKLICDSCMELDDYITNVMTELIEWAPESDDSRFLYAIR